jgi:Lamin Tail Domain
MKHFFTLIALFCCLGSFAQVRISQAYGGGGNGGATYNQDFVELFNAGGSTVAIGGWSVQYASATGTAWAVNAIPAGVNLAPGQYYLVGLAVGGAVGVALPTPDATGTSNMSGTSGKVALVNSTTALSGTTACSNASVVDVLGFGAGSCFETAVFPTTGITTAQSMQRGSNGCTDANNNSTDFALGTVAPRNTGSSFNSCGGPTPFISAGPSITNITSSFGTASASQSYNISAANLTPAAGDITVTPGAGLEISTNNISFGTAPILVPYTAGALATTPIYVRLAASAAQGAFSSSVTHTGGTAPTATVTVTGGVFQNYYNTKANNGLNVVTTWSTTTDGTGASPANFTDGYQLFNIINETNANYTGVWNVTATGNTSRVVVGNGTAPLTFTVQPGADSLTGATRVDILNNGTLVLLNNRRPFLNNIANGSTVSYAQTGTTTADTIRVGALSYFNLILKDGIKLLAGNTTTVRGDLTVNNVQNFNGPKATPFATINAFGDVNFINGTTFEPQPAGDAGRITLAMNNNSGGPQTINGPGVDVLLFRLRRDSTTTDNDINLTPGTNLTLGNSSGGGLQLNQGAATTTILHKGSNNLTLIGAAVSTSTALGAISSTGGNITIAKSQGTSNAGTLRFQTLGGQTGAVVDNFVVNFDPAQTRDSITVEGGMFINNITLTKGRVVLGPTVGTLNFFVFTVTGGSTSSFIDGSLTRLGSAFFPIGKGTKYAPVQLSDAGAVNYTVAYKNTGLGNYTIDTNTLAIYPSYAVSDQEYWNILAQDLGGYKATFFYTEANSFITAPTAMSVAKFKNTDWEDMDGIPNAANTATSGSVISGFVPIFSSGSDTFTLAKPNATGITYTFIGNGNWDNPANWSNNTIPPPTLTAPNTIIISPMFGGSCIATNIVGGQQIINTGAKIFIKPNARIVLPGNLVIQ